MTEYQSERLAQRILRGCIKARVKALGERYNLAQKEGQDVRYLASHLRRVFLMGQKDIRAAVKKSGIKI